MLQKRCDWSKTSARPLKVAFLFHILGKKDTEFEENFAKIANAVQVTL